MNGDTSHDADNGQQIPPAPPETNTDASPRTNRVIIIVGAVVTAILCFCGILGVFLYTAVSQGVLLSMTTAMASRAKDIYVVIGRTITGCDGLTFEPLWPKSGKPMEDAKDMDILDMTFANSSDYFTVLYDGENYGMPEWTPYSNEFDYSKCAGAGVRSKTGGGRLTAENNAWTIAANITGDMPDIIPFIVSRNVDPSSLIPREGDLRQQFLRPSKYMTPFGPNGFLLIRKGGGIYKSTWEYASLDRLYQGANKEELQAIRDAFEKIKYLEP